MAERDIVELLVSEHEEIRQRFETVEAAASDERGSSFQDLVGHLASHEAAEEAVVHRTLRDEVEGAGSLANEVLAEEASAEELLNDMVDMDPSAAEFETKLADLKAAVLAHAAHEEEQEFPLLRDQLDDSRRQELAELFETVRKAAPTRPHPNVPQSPTVRAATGPLAGIFDRTRDAVRDALADR